MDIYLMRHGRTVTPGTYTGVSDVALSPDGALQVRQARSLLGARRFDLCYCSPLRRCRQTFDLLEIGADCRYEPALKEIDFGAWEGRTFADIWRDDEENCSRWLALKENFTFPGGEAIALFNQRISAWFDRLLQNGVDGSVLVVSHAGVIRRALCHLLALEPGCAERFVIREAGVAIVEVGDGFAALTALNWAGGHG